MGRKKIDIDWTQLDSYLQLKASKRTCALLIGVSEDVVEARIKEKYECTFREYAEKAISPVKLKLVQKALSKALDGDNTMLIFCLKNICGWADKIEQEIEQKDGTTFMIKPYVDKGN